MDPRVRQNAITGRAVAVVLKKDQPTGKLTNGHIKRVLTNSEFHHRGIKVMLEESNMVGRIQQYL